MHSCFISQILVIFLESVCIARIFFTKNSKIDAAVMLSPVAFIISILNILVWQLSTLNILIFLLSLTILLTNIRSLLRFSAKLFIDRYSIRFLIFSILEFAAVLTLAFFCFINRSVKINPDDFNSETKTEVISKNFNEYEILKKIEIGKNISGYIQTFSPKNINADNSQNPVILFVPAPSANPSDYEPFFYFLSKQGYTTLAGDFYIKNSFFNGIANSRILRKYLVHKRISAENNSFTEEQKKTVSAEIKECFNILITLASQKFGSDRKFIILTDVLNFDDLTDIVLQNSETCSGFFSLTQIEEYKTPGFGFIEQTDIFTARHFGLKRDPSLFTPRFLSSKMLGFIKKLEPLPNLPEV